MPKGSSRGRRLLGRLAWRGYDAYDRVAYPETDDPANHWVRIVLNDAIDAHIRKLDPTASRAAEVSGDNHRTRPWLSYETLNYPDFDLCAPLELTKRFDVVICEQVLEHVPDPWMAAANLRELISPGGHVIVSTPDQGSRAAPVRHARLLAVLASGHSDLARRGRAGHRLGRLLGQSPCCRRQSEPLGGVPKVAFAP